MQCQKYESRFALCKDFHGKRGGRADGSGNGKGSLPDASGHFDGSKTDNKKKTSVCLLTELEREKQRVEDNAIQLYKEYASGGYSKEEYLSLRKSNQSLLGELEEKIAGIAEQEESRHEPKESEDDLKQCSVLEEYDGNILSKLIDKVYIYGDGNLQVVFKNDDYFQTVCEEGIG